MQVNILLLTLLFTLETDAYQYLRNWITTGFIQMKPSWLLSL